MLRAWGGSLFGYFVGTISGFYWDVKMHVYVIFGMVPLTILLFATIAWFPPDFVWLWLCKCCNKCIDKAREEDIDPVDLV